MKSGGELSVEERLAIQELYARYNFAIDSGNASAYADTFVDEGVLELPGRPAYEGRVAIAGFVTLRSSDPQPGISHSQHWNSSLLLEPKGDYVAGRVYLMLVAIQTATSEVHPVIHGYYSDVIVPRDGAWKFARRTVEVLRNALPNQ